MFNEDTNSEVGSPPTDAVPYQEVTVTTVAKLLPQLVGGHEIGSVYSYLYQGQVVVTVDSLKAGQLFIHVHPSQWAPKIADYIWQYEVDETTTSDPSKSDTAEKGWLAVLPTEYDAEDEDEAESDDTEDGNELDADLTEDEIFNGDADTED